MGWSPLHAAAECGHRKVVRLLVDAGANQGAIGSEEPTGGYGRKAKLVSFAGGSRGVAFDSSMGSDDIGGKERCLVCWNFVHGGLLQY